MQDYIGRILYDESKGRGVCKNVWCLWNREDPNGQLEREYAWRVKWDSSNHDVVLTTKEVAAVDTGNIDLSPALLPEVRAMARAAAEGGKRMCDMDMAMLQTERGQELLEEERRRDGVDPAMFVQPEPKCRSSRERRCVRANLADYPAQEPSGSTSGDSGGRSTPLETPEQRADRRPCLRAAAAVASGVAGGELNGWPGPSRVQQDQQEAAITIDTPGGAVAFTMSDLKALAGFEAAVAALPGFDQAVAAKLQQREQGAACAQLQAGMGWTDQRTRSQQRAVYQQSDPEQQEGEPKQQENELQGQEASGRQTAQPKQQEDDLQGQVSRGMRQQVPRLQPQQGPKGRPRQQQAAEKRPGQQQAAETPSRQQAMQSEGHLGCRSTRSRQAVGGLPQQQVARLKGRPGAKSSGCAGTGAQPVTDKPVKRQRARSEGRSAAQSGGCASLEAQPAAKRRRTAALARQPQAAHDEVAPQKGAPHAVDRPLKQPVEAADAAAVESFQQKQEGAGEEPEQQQASPEGDSAGGVGQGHAACTQSNPTRGEVAAADAGAAAAAGAGLPGAVQTEQSLQEGCNGEAELHAASDEQVLGEEGPGPAVAINAETAAAACSGAGTPSLPAEAEASLELPAGAGTAEEAAAAEATLPLDAVHPAEAALDATARATADGLQPVERHQFLGPDGLPIAKGRRVRLCNLTKVTEAAPQVQARMDPASQVLLAAFQRQLARRMPTHEEASLQAARDMSAAAQASHWPLLIEEEDPMVASRSTLRPQAACKAAHGAKTPAAAAWGAQDAPQESDSTEGAKQMPQRASRNGSSHLQEVLLGPGAGPDQAEWLDLSEASPLAASVPAPAGKRVGLTERALKSPAHSTKKFKAAEGKSRQTTRASPVEPATPHAAAVHARSSRMGKSCCQKRKVSELDRLISVGKGQKVARRLVRLPGDVSLAQQKVTQYGEDEQWEVQAIVAEATDLSGEAIFLVKWKGFELDPDAWTLASDLEECKALDAWEAAHGTTRS